MDHVRSPSEFLYGLKYSSCKEDSSFPVVLEVISRFVAIYALAVEIIFIVNEIHLHSRCRNRRNLDYERSVYFIDDDIHTRQTDNFVKLVLSFVDATIAWHEGTDLLLPLLNALRKVSADVCYIRFREVRCDFRIDEQYPFDRITHTTVL